MSNIKKKDPVRNPEGKGGFVKGKSGNPYGRPVLPDDIKNIRKLTAESFVRMTNFLLYQPTEYLEQIVEQPKNCHALRIIARFLIMAESDVYRFELLINRFLGPMNVVNAMHSPDVQGPIFSVEINEDGKFVTARPKLLNHLTGEKNVSDGNGES